jgi:hypothetical protein
LLAKATLKIETELCYSRKEPSTGKCRKAA